MHVVKNWKYYIATYIFDVLGDERDYWHLYYAGRSKISRGVPTLVAQVARATPIFLSTERGNLGDFKFPRIPKLVSNTNNFDQIMPLIISLKLPWINGHILTQIDMHRWNFKMKRTLFINSTEGFGSWTYNLNNQIAKVYQRALCIVGKLIFSNFLIGIPVIIIRPSM